MAQGQRILSRTLPAPPPPSPALVPPPPTPPSPALVLPTFMNLSEGGKQPRQRLSRIQPRARLLAFKFSDSCLQIWQ